MKEDALHGTRTGLTQRTVSRLIVCSSINDNAVTITSSLLLYRVQVVQVGWRKMVKTLHPHQPLLSLS